MPVLMHSVLPLRCEAKPFAHAAVVDRVLHDDAQTGKRILLRRKRLLERRTQFVYLADLRADAAAFQLFRRRKRFVYHNAVRNERDLTAGALPDTGERLRRSVAAPCALAAARMADGDRAVLVIDRARHHRAQLREARRAENGHARDRAQKRNIEHAVVGRAVRADNARAVDAEHDMQSFNRDIMHDLVVGAL